MYNGKCRADQEILHHDFVLPTTTGCKLQINGGKNCTFFNGTHTVPGVEVTHLILDKGIKVSFL